MIGIEKLLAASILSLACAATSAAKEKPCDRGCLLGIGDSYINALTYHDPRQIGPMVAPDAIISENGVPGRLGEGLWTTIKSLPFRQSFADPKTGQYMLFAVAMEEQDQRAQVAIRLKVKDRLITEVEALVTRKGDHSLFEGGDPQKPLPLWSTPLPASARLPRAKLLYLANEYFETLLRSDPKGLFSPDCERFENGVQTTNNPGTRGGISCTEGAKGYYAFITGVRGRRFPVVDEELGVVVSLAHIDLAGTVKTLEIRGKTIVLPERNQVQRSSAAFAAYKIEYGHIKAIMARVREEPYLHVTVWDK